MYKLFISQMVHLIKMDLSTWILNVVEPSRDFKSLSTCFKQSYFSKSEPNKKYQMHCWLNYFYTFFYTLWNGASASHFPSYDFFVVCKLFWTFVPTWKLFLQTRDLIPIRMIMWIIYCFTGGFAAKLAIRRYIFIAWIIPDSL